MSLHSPVLRWAQAGLALVALLMSSWAYAGSVKFIAQLSPEEKAAMGFSKLSAKQAAVLDDLVSRDVMLAHEGGVTGFSTTFSARHSGRERTTTGMDQLSEKELAALNSFAARAIAMGPPPEQEFEYSPPPTPSPPAPTPPQAKVALPERWEVHGDLSFTVGGSSHGGSFYGTSMDLTATDPSGRFTVGVGFEEFRGKGLIGLCDPYDRLAYGMPYEGFPYGGW